MKDFIKILRFAQPYKSLAVSNVLFNIISIITGLFSVALVIPLLNVLFDQKNQEMLKPEFSLRNIKESFNYIFSDIIHTNGPQMALLFIIGAVMISILFKNLFRYLGLYVMVSLRNYIIRDLREKMYNRILVLPLSYFSSERKGDLISRMSSDIQDVEVSIMSSLEALFKEPLTILITVMVLVWMSPFLTLLVFFTLPVGALVIAWISKLIKKQSARGQSKMGQLIALFEETLGGVRIIKAFSAQAFFNRKFRQENELFTRLNIYSNRLSDANSPISEVLSVVILCMLLWIGGNMALKNNGSISPQEFIGFIIVFATIIAPAKQFSLSYSRMQKGLASLDRIEEVINSKEIIEQVPDALSIKQLNHEIEFRNVSFSYQGERVLNNINLKIEKGKTVALVGPSGSGKSTLVDLVPRFYDPQEGEVLIDGINIRQYVILELRKLMGIVTQESILFNDTIFNNIAFGQQSVSTGAVEKAAQIAHAHDFVLETDNGYQTNIGDRGNKLSGGQRQRISIARAILTDPDVMIMDEATSALDTTSERLVQEALSDAMKGRTTIVIAHRLSTIQNADKIVVLEKGYIVQTGTHSELIKQEGLYRDLHNMQKLIES
ncbi:MAG: ATP-binding cassette domain-containing protein [Bacteroidia bacterium]|nr:ATP-binding cassette domain-containing protein [Bacteroidia bacterium]